MSERAAAQGAERGAGNDGATVAAEGPVMGRRVRGVPRRLALRVLFGWQHAWIYWVVGAFGMLFTLVFLPAADLRILGYDRRTTATVTGVEETSSSENDERIYRVRYWFADEAGVRHEGESFTTSPPQERGAWDVEYDAGAPSESQLVGMRRRPFSAVILIVLVFPIVGLVGGLRFFVRGRRALGVLRRGRETSGTLIDTRATSFKVNGAHILALTFEYEVGGRRRTTEVRTLGSRALEDDKREPMLYDPQAPERAVVLDDLPGGPRIGASGALELGRLRVVPYLLAPVAFAGLAVATILAMVGG